MDEVTIYCDGACSGNPGPAAWGAVLLCKGHRKELDGYIGIATNNEAEVTAAIEALAALKYPCKVIIYSDSKYLVEGAKGTWNITTNLQCWSELEEVAAPHEIEWKWIKGHSGIEGNERANTLANRRAYRGS